MRLESSLRLGARGDSIKHGADPRRWSSLVLEIVRLLCVGEAWQVRRPAGVSDLDAHGRLVFRTGLAKDRERGQRFVVDLRDQKRITGAVLLPHLADLYFFDGHLTNVDIFFGGVNIASSP